MSNDDLPTFSADQLKAFDGGLEAVRAAKRNGVHLDPNIVHKTYIALYGYVYDVTAFLGRHPGGPDVILQFAGKEATDAFEDVYHSREAKNMLKTYLVGKYTPQGSNSQYD